MSKNFFESNFYNKISNFIAGKIIRIITLYSVAVMAVVCIITISQFTTEANVRKSVDEEEIVSSEITSDESTDLESEISE